MSLQPGQTIGHYQLLELIGEGGMGRVFRARDSRLSRYVAIKILKPGLTSDEKLRKRFVREARAAAAVSHPAIASVHEVAESGDSTYIVMEYVEGRTLRKMLKGDPLPLMETLRIGVEIAEGLAEAHRAGVVHRDLKPDNIIVRPDRRPKILDFGIAKLLEERSGIFRRRTSPSTTSLSGEGKIMGTLGYMSPEQARGDEVDARTDIFSLGVILYEMTTGIAPFRGRTPIDTLTSILKEPPPPATQLNPGVHPKVEELLAECLQKDPAKRCQRMEDLVAALRIAQLALQEAALRRTTFEGQALSAPIAGAPRRPALSRRRPKALFLSLALIAAGAVATLLYLRGSAAPPAADPAAPRPAAPPAAGRPGGSREESLEMARGLTASSEAYQHYAAGELALNQALWGEAVTHFERALGIDPSFAPASYRLAMACAWGGHPERSVPVLLEGLPNADRLPEPWKTLYHAQLDWRRLETNVAYTALSELVLSYPHTPDAWYLLGEIHTHSSRHWSPGRARACFQRTLDLEPGFKVVLYHLVYDDLAAEDLVAARRLLEGAPGAGEGDAARAEAELAIAFAEGRIEEALRLGEESLLQGHDNVRLILATAHLAAGHGARAAELTAAHPEGSLDERPVAMLTRAWVLAAVGRLSEALTVFQQARDSLQGTALVRFGAFCSASRAQILMAAGDRDAAMLAAREGVLTDPHYAPAYYWLGRVQLLGGGLAEARATLAELRARMEEVVPEPDLFWSLALQAEINREEGDLGAALAVLGKASELPPERRSPEVNAFTQARVKAAFGDLEGAIAGYREGLRPLAREPWNDRVATPIALHELALLEERAGMKEAARGHLDQFLAAWGKADLPVAAVADARSRRAALTR